MGRMRVARVGQNQNACVIQGSQQVSLKRCVSNLGESADKLPELARQAEHGWYFLATTHCVLLCAVALQLLQGQGGSW